MDPLTKRLRFIVFSAIFAGAAASLGAHDDTRVMLVAKTGDGELSGDLVATEPGFFTVVTAMGTIKIDAAVVDCLGIACPVPGHMHIAAELFAHR